VAKGNLTRISNEEIEANGSNCSNPNMVDHIENIIAADEGDNCKKEEKSNPHPQPAKICSKDGQFFFVTFIKLPTGM
jgi:hypothetical protein